LSSRRTGSAQVFGPVHLLILVAVSELVVTRLAVERLRPGKNEPIPSWFETTEYLGRFLHYLGTCLAIGVLALKVWDMLRDRDPLPGWRGIGRVALATLLTIFAVLATITVVIDPPNALSFAFQTSWAVAIAACLALAFARREDLGVTVGMLVVALPLLVHYAFHFAGFVVLTEDEVFDRSLDRSAADWGLDVMVLSALLSPYCFAPRPVARSLTRVPPIVAAMLLGGLGAMLVRHDYLDALQLGRLFTGIDLLQGGGVSQNDLALYLLAMSTLIWTLTSCTVADAPARREIGIGLGLVILGGHGFEWPLHFLLGLLGLVVILDAAERVRDEESPRALRPRTPRIDDQAWDGWVAALAAALRKDDPGEIKTVTVRGDEESATTLIVGERHGVPFKARFGRLAGALVSIDVVCGREVAETTRATFTLHARPDGTEEPHPSPPPAAPALQLDDAGFSARFRSRGDEAQLRALFDEPLRARAAALLDGWVAWWEATSLRFRVYPAIGAPLDHPVPISDLALRGAGHVERMLGVIDLMTVSAARGLPAEEEAPPTVLE
jgi:hypothetical protein